MDLLVNPSAVQVHLLGKHITKTDDEIERAIARPTYFNPYEAVEFGIIDRVCLMPSTACCFGWLQCLSSRLACTTSLIRHTTCMLSTSKLWASQCKD